MLCSGYCRALIRILQGFVQNTAGLVRILQELLGYCSASFRILQCFVQDTAGL